MEVPTRILGLSGSLRAGSHNQKLLRAAADLLPPEAELVVFEGLKAIPPYDQDDEHLRPEAVQALCDAIREADAVLVSTPEYNHSLPGQFKNALDWLSRPLDESPFKGKPTAVIGTSTGLFGAVWAQAEGRKVLSAIGAQVLDHELPIGLADSAFTDGGALADDGHEAALSEILDALLVRRPVAA
jgi:chromate reductase